MKTATGLSGALAGLSPGADVAVMRDGDRLVVASEPDAVVRASGPEAFDALDQLAPGWWAGFLSYDLGRSVERVAPRATDDTALPDVLLARFARQTVVADVDGPKPVRPIGLTGWTSRIERPEWDVAVARILAHLRAGDCYQVNLTRRLTSDGQPDAVELFRALQTGNPAPHSALFRLGDVAVVSASPERFLRRDGADVESRPIKGTGTDPDALAASAKDRAENVMIVDLARNDLGRVCEYESIHVPQLCGVEQHPGLYHLVSTVRGRLRPDVTVGQIIRATFPPASVTGCPKPRVMQIIEDLEPVRRGVYCGAVGFIDTTKDVIDLNVAIRTFTLTGGRTHFGVGAGIVADSDPAAEWEETELKARKLLSIVAAD